MKKQSDRRPFVVRRYSDVVIVPAHPHGEDVEKQYRLTRDNHFNSVYTEVGELNVSEYVGSFANGCSLKSIIERCSLMPVHDKVRYLQQREDGVSADLSAMPKDGTEAFILFRKMEAEYPDIFKELGKGRSLDSIIGEIAKGCDSIRVSSTDDDIQNAQKSIESEVKS